jgi:hypothetical protein
MYEQTRQLKAEAFTLRRLEAQAGFMSGLAVELRREGLPSDRPTIFKYVGEAIRLGLDSSEAATLYVKSVLHLQREGVNANRLRQRIVDSGLDRDLKLIALRAMVFRTARQSTKRKAT